MTNSDDSSHLDHYSSAEDLEEVLGLYDKLMTKEVTVESLYDEEIIDKIAETFKDIKEMIINETITNIHSLASVHEKLDILRQFIKAERMGNWRLHLKATYEMLPYFAASGHNLYANSAYIYYQMMTKLEDTNPKIHDLFMKGHHVSRRSDRFWAGLSSDLVIEQVLMRSVKTTGGLTRGRVWMSSCSWHLGFFLCLPVQKLMHLCRISLKSVSL